VVTNIQNQGDVYNEIINIITANSDALVDNGNGTFTHTAADGTVVTFDANRSVLTPVQVTGNTIATYDNGSGNVLEVKETITSMTQDNTTGIISYTAENSVSTTANVVSANSGNQITVGTDGGAYYKVANLVKTISNNYSIDELDGTILIDAASSGLAVTLPSANANSGRILVLRKLDETGNIVTLSQQVVLANGVTFNQFNVQGTMRIQSDGTNWYKID